MQGLQVGWSDWYPYYLDCQWVDVTDKPLGNYNLYIETNPASAGAKRIKELDYSNNKVTIDLSCSGCSPERCNFGKCLS